MKEVNCKYSNEMVPYMYGELATSAATEFESHLLECQACTDEFAALSAARYEVYDWKKVEFDPLPTPAIEIPAGEVVSVTWIEKLRAAFSGWAMPAAAFGGVAIIVTLVAVFAISRYETSSPSVARNETNIPANDNTNTNRSAAAPLVRKPEASVKPDVAESERITDPNSKPVVVNDSTPRRAVRTQPAVARPVPAGPRPTRAETQSVPRLNEFSEEEDSSLRLAELFEDIDTRE